MSTQGLVSINSGVEVVTGLSHGFWSMVGLCTMVGVLYPPPVGLWFRTHVTGYCLVLLVDALCAFGEDIDVVRAAVGGATQTVRAS